MKKILIILTIILITGCSNYHLTIDEFRNISLSEGYYLDNQNIEYKNYDYVKDVCYAYDREKDYLVEFINLENNDYAYRFYLTNYEDFQDEITTDSYLKIKNTDNYNLFHLENKKYYMLLLRMDNNIIYINTEIEFKNDIENLLNKLNINY